MFLKNLNALSVVYGSVWRIRNSEKSGCFQRWKANTSLRNVAKAWRVLVISFSVSMSLKTRLADIQEKWEKLGISEKRIQILPGNVLKTLLASFDEFTRPCSLFRHSDLFLQRHVIDSFFDHFFRRFVKFTVRQFVKLVKLETSCQRIGNDTYLS